MVGFRLLGVVLSNDLGLHIGESNEAMLGNSNNGIPVATSCIVFPISGSVCLPVSWAIERSAMTGQYGRQWSKRQNEGQRPFRLPACGSRPTMPKHRVQVPCASWIVATLPIQTPTPKTWWLVIAASPARHSRRTPKQKKHQRSSAQDPPDARGVRGYFLTRYAFVFIKRTENQGYSSTVSVSAQATGL